MSTLPKPLHATVLTGIALVLVMLPAINWPTLPGKGLDLTLNLLVWAAISFWSLTLLPCVWRTHRRSGQITRLLLAGGILMILPWLWTPLAFRGVALLRLGGICALAALLWLLMQTPVRGQLRRQIYAVMVVSGLLQAGLGFCQILLPQFAEKWLDYHFIAASGRPLGGFLQVNLLGSFLATALVCALYLALSGLSNQGKKKTGRVCTRMSWCAFLPLSAALVITQSRSAQAAGLLSIIVLLLLHHLPRRVLLTVVCLLLAGAVLGQAALSLRPSSLHEGARSVVTAQRTADGQAADVTTRLQENRHASGVERWTMVMGTASLIAHSPLWGAGLATFEVRFPEELAQRGITNPFTVSVVHPHNELLYVWVEGGLIALSGLLLWLAIAWKPFAGLAASMSSWRQNHPRQVNKKREAARGMLLVPLMVHVMTEYPLYLCAIHSVLLIILLWLALPARYRVPRRCLRQLPHSRRWIALPISIICLLGMLFTITGLQAAASIREAESFRLMDPTLLERLLNPHAQPERLLFDRAVSDLMQFNITRENRWLYLFQSQAGTWLTRHNDANLIAAMMTLAYRQRDALEADHWRQRGCLSFSLDPRFKCSQTSFSSSVGVSHD